MIGTTPGHYKVTERIGAGGMGVVYNIRDTRLDRFVAVKVLPSKKVADASRMRRSAQRASAASALHHPNVIRIHHVHRSEGTDSSTQEHHACGAAAQPIRNKGSSLSEMSWSRPHV